MVAVQDGLLEVMEQWDSFVPVRSARKSGDWNKRLLEANRLLDNESGLPDPLHVARLYEAMSTSDFPLLLADKLDRETLAQFAAIPPQMRKIARVKPGRGFNTRKRTAFEGLMGRLPRVEELGQYKARKRTEREYTYEPNKYGSLVPFSWEMWLNDDLGALDNIPMNLSTAARMTEEWFLTQLFFDSNGPRDSYFADSELGNGLVATGASSALSVESLETAIQAMTGAAAGYRMDDVPAVNVPRYIMISPSDTILLEQILSSATFAVTDGSGSLTRTAAANTISTRNLIPIVNPWIPIVVSGSKGQTCWALFSETVKPCEFGLVRGHENPELFIAASGAQRIGGGDDPFSGSLHDDSITYKVRYCFGGTTLDPRGGYGSDGQ